MLLVLLANANANAQSRTRIPAPRDRVPATASNRPGVCPVAAEPHDTIRIGRLDIGRAAWGGSYFVNGPRIEAVVEDHATWARLWPVIADTVALPLVDFDKSAVIVVATAFIGSSPTVLAIERVIRCRTSGGLTALLRLHWSPTRLDAGERSIRAVMVPRVAVAYRHVAFLELPPIVDDAAATTP